MPPTFLRLNSRELRFENNLGFFAASQVALHTNKITFISLFKFFTLHVCCQQGLFRTDWIISNEKLHQPTAINVRQYHTIYTHWIYIHSFLMVRWFPICLKMNSCMNNIISINPSIKLTFYQAHRHLQLEITLRFTLIYPGKHYRGVKESFNDKIR